MDPGSHNNRTDSGQPGYDEARALMRFAEEAGLVMNREAVAILQCSADAMRGGREHRAAWLRSEGRVIKDADVHALATESMFDYLTDLLLSNYFFDDDIQMLGCYELEGRVHLVTSQPYVDGDHPDWAELKAGLVRQGLRDPYPNCLDSVRGPSGMGVSLLPDYTDPSEE